MKTGRVVIVGAGIGGMATANLLAKAGMKVTILEKDFAAGGRAGILKAKGFTFDTGPSWYLMPEVFEHYYNLLEEDVNKCLDLTRLDPAYKVFFEEDDPIIITSNLELDAKTFESIESGSGKQLKKYVKKSNSIYQLSIKHFLYSNFQTITDFMKPEVLKNGISMLKMAVMPIHRYISGFVSDLRLKQILEYPMVFLGTSPFDAPALYSLMSALDFKEGVFYPNGGIYKIIESLEKIGTKLGVEYRYGSGVKEILIENGEVKGVKLQNNSIINADIVVSNADLNYTETELIKEKRNRSYPDKYWANKQASPSALLIYLGLKGSISQFEHHNLLFVKKWKQNFDDIYKNKKSPESASIYICNPSKTDSCVAPKGHENIFVLVPLPAGIELNRKNTDELTNHYIKQIEAMTNVDLNTNQVFKKIYGPDDFKTKLYSWQSSMLGQSHILKQSAFFRTPNKSKKIDGLYYVGASTTPGVGLPMCLIGAELIYKRLTGDRRGGKVNKIDRIKMELN